jgi:site-specific DNA-methyltransferase (adenine-specific)
MSNITMLNGDCLELMANLADNSVDMILVDLPYGTTGISWDSVIPFDKMWEQFNRVTKDNAAIVLFASQPFTTDLICSNRKDYKYSLVWKKNVPTGMSSAKYRPMKYHEDICVFHKRQPTYNPIMKERIGVGKACYNYDHYCGESNHVKLEKVKKKYDPDWVQPSSVLEFNVVPNRKGKLHPTQKPVELLEYLIKTFSNEGDTVLDCCAGSFSTGVACINTNRDFIGIEKDVSYFNIGTERLNNAVNTNQMTLEG